MNAAGCVQFSGRARQGFTGAGVDNCLATLARLRPGRVMSIGTVEAGGEVLHSGWRKGRVSVWSEQGRSVASGVEEGRLRLPGRGSGVRFLGSGLWAGEGRGAGHAARWARAGRSFDLDVRQVVCALALEWRGFAFGSEGRRQRGSSGRGG